MSQMIVHTCFNNRSEHGFKSNVLKSGICKYIRRGVYDKFTWCVMEMALFQKHEKGKGLVTNLINRLKVLVMEELSFHDVIMTSHLINLLDMYDKDRNAYHLLLTFCTIVSTSKRNRMVSYINCWFRYNDIVVKDMSLSKVIKYRKAGDTSELLNLGENLIHYIDTKDEQMMGIFSKMYKMEHQGLRYRRKDASYLWFEILADYMNTPSLKIIHKFALEQFHKKAMTERPAFAIWIGIMVWKRDNLTTESKEYCMVEESDTYYKNMKQIAMDDFVTNDYHVNKAFGLGDFAENGAFVNNEYLDLFENAHIYKTLYIEKKKEADQGKCIKKKHKKEPKVIENGETDTLQKIVDEFSGKEFTKGDLITHCSKQSNEFISWDKMNDILVIEEGVCGGKFPCIRVSYNGKDYILKEMGKSMNFGLDYLVADKCKHLFGLRDMNMRIIQSDEGLLRKDSKNRSYVGNWVIDKKASTYCMMNYFKNIGDIGKHKHYLNDDKVVYQCMKIRLYDGLFRSSDNILRNILVNKEGDLLSIDEGDLFGKRKQIFNKNDWCRKNASMDMVNSLLEDMFTNRDDKKNKIIKVLKMYGFPLEEFSSRFDNYEAIVRNEL